MSQGYELVFVQNRDFIQKIGCGMFTIGVIVGASCMGLFMKMFVF